MCEVGWWGCGARLLRHPPALPARGSWDAVIRELRFVPQESGGTFESILMRWMKLEPIIQSEVSQKDKDRYNILTHIYGI